MKIRSYPKVFSIGDARIRKLFDSPFVVQEKIDGSQLSFMWDSEGTLHLRSKGKEQCPHAGGTDGLFTAAAEYLLQVEPQKADVVFRAEYLAKPKHNTIAYDRIPENHLILFDVEPQEGRFASEEEMAVWADRLQVEMVPAFNSFQTVEALKENLHQQSVLGGATVEGFVVKNYFQWHDDGTPWAGKILVGKLVSEQFVERNSKNWEQNKKPSPLTVVKQIVDSLNTEPRFRKAVQTLRDDGALSGTAQDIGALMKHVKHDIAEEEAQWVKEQLFEKLWPLIQKQLGRGLPEWYKQQLIERQFDDLHASPEYWGTGSNLT